MHRLANQLNPDYQQDLLWDYDEIDQFIPNEVHAVTELFNASDYDDLVLPLRAAVKTDAETGIDYALLADVGSSRQKAVVHFNPFANGMTDSMLLRARYLQLAFDGFDISDQHGHELPMLTFAAPSGSPEIKLKRQHRKKTAKGEFEAIAHEYLTIIQAQGFRSVRIIGFSQGATLATSVAAHAHDYGIDVSHVAIGEPANVIRRTRLKLGQDFNASAKHLNTALDASGIKHLQNYYTNESTIRYILGLSRMGRLNSSLIKGLSRDTFTHDLEHILRKDVIITIGWGGFNTISPADAMRAIVRESRTAHDTHEHAIHSVELTTAHHTWAGRLNVLATFYAYALVR